MNDRDIHVVLCDTIYNKLTIGLCNIIIIIQYNTIGLSDTIEIIEKD